MFAAFNFRPQIPMPVIPNLPEQQMLSLHDFGQPTRLEHAAELKVVVGEEVLVDFLDHIDQRDRVRRDDAVEERQ